MYITSGIICNHFKYLRFSEKSDYLLDYLQAALIERLLSGLHAVQIHLSTDKRCTDRHIHIVYVYIPLRQYVYAYIYIYIYISIGVFVQFYHSLDAGISHFSVCCIILKVIADYSVTVIS